MFTKVMACSQAPRASPSSASPFHPGSSPTATARAALTLAAAALMSGALVAHALPGFWPLLAMRFIFGLGFGTVWTAGIAWITELAPSDRREEALAA